MKVMSPVFINVLFLLWIACLASTVTAQDESCMTTALTDYMSCVGANPCTCLACEPPEEGLNPDFPITCRDLNQLVCPTVRCCSACSASLEAYYQCSVVDVFASNGLLSDVDAGESCPLDCSSFPAKDVVDPTCNESDYECVDEYSDYLGCYLSCGAAADCTPPDSTALDSALAEAGTDAGDVCSALNTHICPTDPDVHLDECCPQCDGKMVKVVQCVVNQALDEPCTIECAQDKDATTPPSGPTGIRSPTQAPINPPSAAATRSRLVPTMALADGTAHAIHVLLAASMMFVLFN